MSRYRHYCRKCGVTWYDDHEQGHCEDCAEERKAKKAKELDEPKTPEEKHT